MRQEPPRRPLLWSALHPSLLARRNQAMPLTFHEPRSVPLRTIAPVTAIALAVFAAWRWWGAGDATGALLAVLCALPAIASVLLLEYYRRHLPMAGLLLCAANALGSLLAAWRLGSDGLAWSYLALMANFFIVRSGVAIPANLLLALGLLAMPGLLLGEPPRVSAILVIVLILGFGHRFFTRLQDDRTHMEALASLDALTGLPNRRLLEDTLTRLIADPRSRRRQHALIVLDIDRFKEVNDLYGHRAGDIALSDLATILRFELRGQDQVFRFGGEEFVVLVHAPTRDALEGVTERLRKAVYQSLRGPGGRITVSLGGAMYTGEPHWQDWFSRADTALYLAKGAGRNNYVIADDLD